MSAAPSFTNADHEREQSALPLSALKGNPLIDVMPQNTLDNVAEVLALIQDIAVDPDPESDGLELNKAATAGLCRVLDCARGALEYETRAGLERKTR